MKKRLIAIAFSDLHLNNWSKFNQCGERMKNGFRVLLKIAEISHNKQVPAIFCGDLFHKPDNLDQELGLMMVDTLNIIENKLPNCRIYAIEGNHDLKLTSRMGDEYIRGWISMFERKPILNVLRGTLCLKDFTLVGIPYIDNNVGVSEYLNRLPSMTKSILVLHTNYKGAKDTDGRIIDAETNINTNLFNKFNLVLCGHIHKPQRLSKKVYMVGAPIQQRRTDRDCKLGYWEVYDDFSVEFIELTGYPKFIDVDDKDKVLEDGNYYTVIPKQNTRVEVNTSHNITKKLSKKSLARRYMKEIGIKDKHKKELLIDILNKAESC